MTKHPAEATLKRRSGLPKLNPRQKSSCATPCPTSRVQIREIHVEGDPFEAGHSMTLRVIPMAQRRARFGEVFLLKGPSQIYPSLALKGSRLGYRPFAISRPIEWTRATASRDDRRRTQRVQYFSGSRAGSVKSDSCARVADMYSTQHSPRTAFACDDVRVPRCWSRQFADLGLTRPV